MSDVEALLEQILERMEHRYYGKYRGVVAEVGDPQELGRIRCYVPRLLGWQVKTGWALPCAPYSGPDQGLYTVPDVGAGVWVEFEGGDLSSPIWSGMWWGRPSAGDVAHADATATEHRTDPELPQHDTPRRKADPQVRIWKSSTGHHVVLDDNPSSERLEIEDSTNNRLILDHEGLKRILHNEQTVNSGSRSAQIDGSDSTRIGADRTETLGGTSTHTIGGDVVANIGGRLEINAFGSMLRTTIDQTGMTEAVQGNRTQNVQGSYTKTVTGSSQETAVGGFGVVAGGGINLASGGAVSIGAAIPAVPPSLTSAGIDALMGNVSINTKLGICQIGGMTAFSPLVLGDGLMMHHTMLAQISKMIFPPLAMVYGPAMDAWAAMGPVLDLSYFAFVKRFPFG